MAAIGRSGLQLGVRLIIGVKIKEFNLMLCGAADKSNGQTGVSALGREAAQSFQPWLGGGRVLGLGRAAAQRFQPWFGGGAIKKIKSGRYCLVPAGWVNTAAIGTNDLRLGVRLIIGVKIRKFSLMLCGADFSLAKNGRPDEDGATATRSVAAPHGLYRNRNGLCTQQDCLRKKRRCRAKSVSFVYIYYFIPNRFLKKRTIQKS